MEIKQEIAQVQKRPETFADIRKETEARFRELVEAWMQRRSTFQTTLGVMQAFNNVFDRLEAAHEREMSKNASKNGCDFGQFGDCAKLREALKQVNELNDLWFDTFTLPDGATSIHDEIENVISAALAAPPRNCNHFATVDEARKAHEAICEKYGKCHHGCPLNNEEHYSAFDCFEAWLFAPATEQEGGAK